MVEIPEVECHVALHRAHSKGVLAGSNHDLAGGAHQLLLVCGAQAVQLGIVDVHASQPVDHLLRRLGSIDHCFCYLVAALAAEPAHGVALAGILQLLAFWLVTSPGQLYAMVGANHRFCMRYLHDLVGILLVGVLAWFPAAFQ